MVKHWRDKYQSHIPPGKEGEWEVKRFTVTPEDASLERLRSAFSGGRGVPEGTYTGLFRGDCVIMSDTPDEIRDHVEAIYQAKGQCLVAGLGLGVVVQAMLAKPEVQHITVIEIAPEVINLVAPYLACPRLTVIEADIFEWVPPKGAYYDVAWFDIWDNRCSDDLPQMASLKRRFGRRAAWKGCWGEEEIRDHKRRYGW